MVASDKCFTAWSVSDAGKKFSNIATWRNVVQDVDGFPVGLSSFELGNEPGQLAVHVHAIVQGPARVEHGEVVTLCRE